MITSATHTAQVAFTRIAYYIVAHADDWQLFMQPHPFDDLTDPACKVVFIITTAGDAGFGEKFWRAREEGHKSSVRFCIAASTDIDEREGTSLIADSDVSCWYANNSRTYFLRLPDGHLDGTGFKANAYSSLAKLRTNESLRLTALDQSSVYADWSFFVEAIEAIITFERQSIEECKIHYLNPDASLNPNDHADHVATGEAIQATKDIGSISQMLYTGYTSHSNERSMDAAFLFWKSSVFAAYEKSVFDICGYSTLKEAPGLYLDWCARSPQFVTLPAQKPLGAPAL